MVYLSTAVIGSVTGYPLVSCVGRDLWLENDVYRYALITVDKNSGNVSCLVFQRKKTVTGMRTDRIIIRPC